MKDPAHENILILGISLDAQRMPRTPLSSLWSTSSDTCAETGLSSKGSFSTSSQTGKLSGSYMIEWPAPTFTFKGAITATLTFP